MAEEGVGSLGAGVTCIVSYLVLGTELSSSGRARNTLNCEPSLRPSFVFY